MTEIFFARPQYNVIVAYLMAVVPMVWVGIQEYNYLYLM